MTDLATVKPLGHKLLVKLLPLYSEKTPAGLTLVDPRKHWDHKSRRGEVVATGPRVLEVVVGDIAHFTGAAGRWVGDPAVQCEQDVCVFRSVDEDEVLAVEVKENGI